MIETAHGRHDFAAGDRIQFTGTDKKQGIHNGRAGTIAAIDGSHVTVTLDGRARRKPSPSTPRASIKFRHGYAGTIYKAQGRTLDQTYLYHSEHWRSAASYVALTRHRDKTELFVATNTAADVKELARQMARTDDRRAASQFHYAPEIAAAPLTAAELHARFSADATPSAPHQGVGGHQERSGDGRAVRPAAARRQPERTNHCFSPSVGCCHIARGGMAAGVLSRPTMRADPWTAVYLRSQRGRNFNIREWGFYRRPAN